MRVFVLLLSALTAAAAANAQTPATPAAPTADAPGVQVVKFGWSKERIDWEQNPFGGPNENFHEMQFRARAEKRAADAKKSNSPEASKLERDARADAAIVEAERRKKGPPRYAFLYKASVKNDGAKTIRAVDWDYVFFDTTTGQEVGRHQFTSDAKIEPGKTKEFSFFIPSAPAKTINVYALNKKEREGLEEQVILVRVQYSDGSAWQRPQPQAAN
ncbi:MAG: hypothetical protein ACRD68_07825 [Pyrinomonadaceae bacterium]